MAGGLGRAHRHGVIHRDVRPRNIAVGPRGVVKLGNFDLAFILDAPNLSIAQSIRGHFDRRYVDPAVWENPRDVGPSSDVYSLGLVLCQLITGQPPLHDVGAVLTGRGPAGDTNVLTAKLSRKGTPDFMNDPDGAAEVIGRMCAPQRSDRYAGRSAARPGHLRGMTPIPYHLGIRLLNRQTFGTKVQFLGQRTALSYSSVRDNGELHSEYLLPES